ncbi:LLM class flavin-dependent oxidoreductase [Thermogemmatispora sp.]|uniref:LLM class flavin-dependent oxidoreductase n=1 Tax=Thermogemmatispora sp. TaxID=1968838 RepID=UPI0035E3FD9B
MLYGLHLPNFGPLADVRLLCELAREAEAAGWDGFFLWDQIARTTLAPTNDPLAEVWVALTAIALHTRRLRFGPLVTPLPRRRPWELARQAVTLDHLSGGRLVLGVGLGGGYFDFAALGEPSDLKVLGAMLDEGLAILEGLWSGQPFRFEGRYYHIEEAHFLPPPLQQPRIPIWVAGMWPNRAPLRRAARWDGFIPIGRDLALSEMLSPEAMAEIVAALQQLRSQPGPFEVVHFGISSGEDAEADRTLVAAYARVGVTWWVENIVPERWGTWQQWPLEAMRRRIRQGPPR